MDVTDIEVESREGVLSLRFNRPAKKNAITTAMYQRLTDAFTAAETDRSVRVILIRGGDAMFCAGNDLDDFLRAPPMGADAPVLQFLSRISTARKPVVAAVAGAAIGIGVTLLLHCDLVYAAENATFSLPFARLGLCPEAASSLLLPQLAGYHVAAEKLMLGEPFDAQEARAMRLVNRVVPANELESFAFAQARKLAAMPGSSLRATKALMKSDAQAVAHRMGREAEQFGQMLRSPEAREAFTAFAEKRPPDFSTFD